MSSNFILNLARRSAGLAPLVPIEPGVPPAFQPDVSFEEVAATTEPATVTAAKLAITAPEITAISKSPAPESTLAPQVALLEAASLTQTGPAQTESSPAVELRTIEKTTAVLAEPPATPSPSPVIPIHFEETAPAPDFARQGSPRVVPAPITAPQSEITTAPVFPAIAGQPVPAAALSIPPSAPLGTIQRTAESPAAVSPPAALPTQPDSNAAPAEIRVVQSAQARAQQPLGVIETSTLITAEPAVEPAIVVQPLPPRPPIVRSGNKQPVQPSARPVQVRIGTIEVQSASQPPAAPIAAPSTPAAPSSEGFAEYIGMRTYVSWERS